MITVRLTSSNMGDVTAQDFEFWCDFVTTNLETQCGFKLEVDSYRFGEAARNYIGGATNEEETTIRETLTSLWDDFCNGAWDAAKRRTGP